MVGTVQDRESRVRCRGHLRPLQALWQRLHGELQDAGQSPDLCQENLKGDKTTLLETHEEGWCDVPSYIDSPDCVPELGNIHV